MDMDDYFLDRTEEVCKDTPKRELAANPPTAGDRRTQTTAFQNDITILVRVYLVYEYLYTIESCMQAEPMKSEGELIRKLISGWPRERAIPVYKYLYVKERLALREEKKSACELDNALIRSARFSRDINIRKPTLAEILEDEINRFWLVEQSVSVDMDDSSLLDFIAGIGIIHGTPAERPAHIFEFPCFADPPVPPNATELDSNRLMDYYGHPGKTRKQEAATDEAADTAIEEARRRDMSHQTGSLPSNYRKD